MGVSETLIGLRKSAGITQAQIAKELGITPAYYGRLEKKAEEQLSWDQLRKLAKFLNVSFERLLLSDKIPDMNPETNHANLLEEFSMLMITHWVHDYLKEILTLFKHDLKNDSLFISSFDDRKKLSSFLYSMVG